jgi:molybdopterin molybdotransferase
MISVDEAQKRLLALATPLPPGELPLREAIGHYLAHDVVARRTQPAADLSSMDGYAIRIADLPGPWRVNGESAAGRPFDGVLKPGEAVRIFTGAHVPAGADTILVQEDGARDGETLRLIGEGPAACGAHIRRSGTDFSNGDTVLTAGQLMHAGAVAVAAMAGFGSVRVGGKPKVAIIACGDELRQPGEPCNAAHIPSSNSVMLEALLAKTPAAACDRGIAPDRLDAIEAKLRDCADCDVIVTTGGASVGDHDLVQRALRNVGAEIDFWKVAMRPGKPVMAGRLCSSIVLGLPGNPSSAFVTAFLLLLPLVRHLAGDRCPFPDLQNARSTHDLPAGGIRADYWRAKVESGDISRIFDQDSGITLPLASANALLINPVDAPPRPAGSIVQYLRIE